MINTIYPTIYVDEHTPEQGLISDSAIIKLGSRIYFFGGGGFFDLDWNIIPDHIPLDKRLSVRFLDTDHLERGFQSGASPRTSLASSLLTISFTPWLHHALLVILILISRGMTLSLTSGNSCLNRLSKHLGLRHKVK